jgi:hypothetical protein
MGPKKISPFVEFQRLDRMLRSYLYAEAQEPRVATMSSAGIGAIHGYAQRVNV